ncbi:MAG: Hsp70 family protein [Opitutaceae bacterium]|nr:Hsp70 family protein [Opitutaceae bacterium]
MQEGPHYSIGIDLGTTNCALAYAAIGPAGGESAVLPIPQRADLLSLVERSTLPSFLYLPTEREAEQIGGDLSGLVDGWILGLAARQRLFVAPDRVVHSAKSWLCQHSVAPDAPLLPWRSGAIAETARLSPIGAATRALSYLRAAWNARMGSGAPFECQSVTITVPASFDLAAQQATLEAARLAGFPVGTRLLEEPQAAFYRWLEGHGEGGGLAPGQRVLVVDIGGGTSDFCLFQVLADRVDGGPGIERVAVSDHILLGGDNIDLALAHALEPLLATAGQELSADQWGHLIARSRELKERCLVDDAQEGERFGVALPSRGSGLLAGTLSTSIQGADVRSLLLDGFFPLCPQAASPERPASGLLEWGLPYAADCAVTRHLAEFLRATGGRVDAVLFNGGTLKARLVRNRLLEQLGQWQGGVAPVCLENEETDLAVARGAAYAGALGARRAPLIAAGLARALYLEIGAAEGGGGAGRLLCALPRGAPAEVPVAIALPGLRLTANRLVRFEVWQGDLQEADRAGALRPGAAAGFARLPPLETRIETAGAPASVPVRIRSVVTETGILRVECLEEGPGAVGCWALEFNTRGPAAAGAEATPPVRGEPQQMDRALAELKVQVLVAAPKASRILTRLETILDRERGAWTLPELRQLADGLLALSRARTGGDVREECWLQLVGYAARPGFGLADDPSRIDRIWEMVFAPTTKRPPRVEVQELLLWRRLAGGLDPVQQLALLERYDVAGRDAARISPERTRLLGALEKVPVERKQPLVEWCLTQGLQQAKEGGYAAACFATLGQLLSRAPFRAGPEQVLAPIVVVEAFERVRGCDWREPAYRELVPAFLKAARIVDDRALDLPARARRQIVEKLEASGVAGAKLGPVLEYRPLTRLEQASSFGETLPLGLSFD